MNSVSEMVKALSLAPDGVKVTVFPSDELMAEITPTAKALGVKPEVYLRDTLYESLYGTGARK